VCARNLVLPRSIHKGYQTVLDKRAVAVPVSAVLDTAGVLVSQVAVHCRASRLALLHHSYEPFFITAVSHMNVFLSHATIIVLAAPCTSVGQVCPLQIPVSIQVQSGALAPLHVLYCSRHAHCLLVMLTTLLGSMARPDVRFTTTKSLPQNCHKIICARLLLQPSSVHLVGARTQQCAKVDRIEVGHYMPEATGQAPCKPVGTRRQFSWLLGSQ